LSRNGCEQGVFDHRSILTSDGHFCHGAALMRVPEIA
jgi:hypothetical protein